MKILVVGAGSMGCRRLRDLTYLNPGGVLLLEPVVTRCAEVAKAFGIPGFQDLDHALSCQPDTFVISTPPALHEPYVRLALVRGMHVFAEVPFVLSYDLLKKVAQQTLSGNTVTGVSHTIRYYPPYRLIHDLLKSSTVGRPLYFEYSLGNYLPEWHPHEDYREFYASDQQLGGAGMDMLLHELSAIQWWLGKITHVQARLSKVSSLEIVGPDSHDVLVRFFNGTVGFYHHDLLERGTAGRHVRIVGEEGTIEWHQDRPTIRIYRGNNNSQEYLGYERAADWDSAMEASRQATYLLSERRNLSGHIPTQEATSFTYESCYLREMTHFVAAVRGSEPYTGCTIQEELSNVNVFHAILDSARQGREIELE